jgi:hypothetical protein
MKNWFNWGKKPILKNPEIDSPEIISLKKGQYRAIMKNVTEIAETKKIKIIDNVKKLNSKCPKCGNMVIVDHFQKVKGDVKGINVGGLGSINGTIDTKAINFCTNPACTHQWEKELPYFIDPQYIITQALDELRWAIDDYQRIDNVTFDPSDILEKFDSLEDKLTNVNLNIIKNRNLAKEFWGDTCIEVIHTFALQDTFHLIFHDNPEYVNESFPSQILHDQFEYKYAKELI